jgi:hypothetical protein
MFVIAGDGALRAEVESAIARADSWGDPCPGVAGRRPGAPRRDGHFPPDVALRGCRASCVRRSRPRSPSSRPTREGSRRSSRMGSPVSPSRQGSPPPRRTRSSRWRPMRAPGGGSPRRRSPGRRRVRHPADGAQSGDSLRRYPHGAALARPCHLGVASWARRPPSTRFRSHLGTRRGSPCPR